MISRGHDKQFPEDRNITKPAECFEMHCQQYFLGMANECGYDEEQ